MSDGYTSETVNRVFGTLREAFGVTLLCVWDFHDAFGYGGNSDFYVLNADGHLHELHGDLWCWLNRAPDSPDAPTWPGEPSTWFGQLADVDAHDHCGDGRHNTAVEDRCCSR